MSRIATPQRPHLVPPEFLPADPSFVPAHHSAKLIAGVKSDDRFGFVLVLGSGGLLANLGSDITHILLPTGKEVVCGALAGLRVNALLQGFRARPRGDVEASVDAVIKIAQKVEMSADELIELDLNPLIVRPCGSGVVGVDASVFVKW